MAGKKADKSSCGAVEERGLGEFSMQKNTVEPKRIITVAGCKGGVGKSIVAVGLALELGRRGNKVVLVDADLGGANLHTYLGIQAPRFVINDFLTRHVSSIEKIILPTDFEGVSFISSAGNIPSQANPKFAQKIKIINSLMALRTDVIIVDIGAGSSYDVMDFFSMTDKGVLVTVPEPTSIINSYGFVKNVVYRRFMTLFRQYPLVVDLIKRGMNPDAENGISAIKELLADLAVVNPECWLKAKSMLSSFMPNIIVNMTSTESDVKLGEKLKAIITKYLSVEATCLGEIPEDPSVKTSAKKMVPFSVLAPNSNASQAVKRIVQHLLRQEGTHQQSFAEVAEPEHV